MFNQSRWENKRDVSFWSAFFDMFLQKSSKNIYGIGLNSVRIFFPCGGRSSSRFFFFFFSTSLFLPTIWTSRQPARPGVVGASPLICLRVKLPYVSKINTNCVDVFLSSSGWDETSGAVKEEGLATINCRVFYTLLPLFSLPQFNERWFVFCVFFLLIATWSLLISLLMIKRELGDECLRKVRKDWDRRREKREKRRKDIWTTSVSWGFRRPLDFE